MKLKIIDGDGEMRLGDDRLWRGDEEMIMIKRTMHTDTFNDEDDGKRRRG